MELYWNIAKKISTVGHYYSMLEHIAYLVKGKWSQHVGLRDVALLMTYRQNHNV